VLDFGVEAKASLRIVSVGVTASSYPEPGMVYCEGARVHIRLGESLSECCSQLGVSGSTNDHAKRDFEASVLSMSDCRYGESGFRFARIDFLDPTAELRIAAVVADGEVLDLPVRYEYSGDDEMVKEIYKVAKRTIDLCAAGEYVWDGIKRDRLVWIGDMHPEMLALTTLYGKTEVLENSLRFIRDTTPKDEWMCFMTYSAWWVILLSDYSKRTGAWDFAQENAEYASALIQRFLSFTSEDGEILGTGFVDWQTHGTPDAPAGDRAILLYMANEAKSFFDRLGMPSAQAQELAERLRKKPITVKDSLSVTGLKFFAEGSLDENEIALLKDKGAKGLTTFMSYYILSAYAHYYGKDEALAVMKEYYGGMLSRGATTFWEDFNLAWLEGSGRIDELPKKGEKDLHGDYGAHCYVGFRHSLCHAWSTGILTFLEENGF
jgi:hypothetical protein